MKALDLIALMPGDGCLDLSPALSVATVSGWRAVFATARGGLWRNLNRSRKAMIHRIQQRQLWLEALLPQGTVLPALQGTQARPDQLLSLTQANAAVLTRLSEMLTGMVQYQITIRCDAVRAAQLLSRSPGPFAGRASPESWVAAFDAYATDRLGNVPGLQVLALPVRDDLVVNYAVLLPQQNEPDLDHALQEIDGLWPEGLSIQQVGPSPGVSFASFGLRPVSQTMLAAAAELLDLPQNAGLEQIGAARHAALKRQMAPAEKVRDAADLLECAAMLAEPGPFPHLFTWAEGQSVPEGLFQKAGAA